MPVRSGPAPRDTLAPPPPAVTFLWRLLPLGVLIVCATLAMLAGYQMNRPDVRPRPRRLTVCVVNVGSGEAAWLQTPGGRFVLIGGGPPEAAPRVVRSLKTAGARALDLVVAPYPYAEAIGGLPAVLAALPITGERGGGVWESGYPPPPKQRTSSGGGPNGAVTLVPAPPVNEWQNALNQMLQRDRVPVQVVAAGKSFDLGDGVRAEILAPAPPVINVTPGAPNNSVVLRITYGQTAFLFAGGLETAGENALLARAAGAGKNALAADWLRVARCGTRGATSPEFLAQVQPEYAVISAGPRSEAGWPHRETLDRLEAAGTVVRRTDVAKSDLVFESDGSRVAEVPAP